MIAALIKLWLCTPETAAAGRAQDVIVGLLLADEGGNTTSDNGIMDEGLMRRRILCGKDI